MHTSNSLIKGLKHELKWFKGVGFLLKLLRTDCKEAGDLEIEFLKTNQQLKQWVKRPRAFSKCWCWENAIAWTQVWKCSENNITHFLNLSLTSDAWIYFFFFKKLKFSFQKPKPETKFINNNDLSAENSIVIEFGPPILFQLHLKINFQFDEILVHHYVLVIQSFKFHYIKHYSYL